MEFYCSVFQPEYLQIPLPDLGVPVVSSDSAKSRILEPVSLKLVVDMLETLNIWHGNPAGCMVVDFCELHSRVKLNSYSTTTRLFNFKGYGCINLSFIIFSFVETKAIFLIIYL